MALPDNDHLVALVQRMGDGDRDAAGELWDDIAPWIHAALLRMLRDEEAAELLTRRTVLEVWRAAPMYDQHVGRPLLWALAMARSLGIQWLEDERRSHRDGPALTAPSGIERQEARAPGSHVGSVLASLPPDTLELLEAAWFFHAVDEDGIRVPEPQSLDEPLRAFARTLAGG